MQTLLVANAGGHFEELRLLRERLGVLPEDSTWVTWDTPQTRSELHSEETIFVARSEPRDLRHVVRYAHTAHRILGRRRFRRVVSTGSIVAVPFLTVARSYGVPCHYIESAARVAGPSLSARILERVPGVHCYGQWDAWARHHKAWQFPGCVFDAFLADTREPQPIRKVVVTVGTSRYGFPRLVDAVRAVLPSDAEVTWQVGSMAAQGAPGHGLMTQTELAAAMREADLVIAHAGVGTALQAMSAGHCPILVPRRADRGEHVDDHQIEVAAELSNRSLATVCEPEEITLEALTRATTQRIRPNDHPPEFVLDER